MDEAELMLEVTVLWRLQERIHIKEAYGLSAK